MISNYIKLAFRQMLHSKIYSAINIAGLAIGLTACFSILIYVLYQLSYDKHNEKLDNIYLVLNERKLQNWTEPNVPFVLGPALKDELPEVELYARWARSRINLTYKNTNISGRSISSDYSIFDILTLPIINGEIRTAEKGREGAVVSESLSKLYFNGNPIGETITTTIGEKQYDFKIIAVMKDIPKTSSISADLILPLYVKEEQCRNQYPRFAGIDFDPASWQFYDVNTFIMFNSNANKSEMENKLALFSKKHLLPTKENFYHLFPFKDIYFHSSYLVNDIFRHGDIKNVYIYSAAAVLILLMGIINYIMLGIGKSALRLKEIGVRKVIGALKQDLLKQFLIESFLITFLALPIALLFVQILLPHLTGLLGEKISTGYFHNFEYFCLFALITLLVGILTGSYIAIYLAKLSPVKILENEIALGKRKVYFRRIMLVTQLVISTGLIFIILTINKQKDYLEKGNTGYEKENLWVFSYLNPLKKDFESFKNEIMSNPNITDVSGANALPGTINKGVASFTNFENPEITIPVDISLVTNNFIETMQMQVIKGTSFKYLEQGSVDNTCILNETAVQKLSIKDPVGKILSHKMIGQFRIAGVIKDFHNESFRVAINPLVLILKDTRIVEAAVRIKPENLAETISFIREKSKQFNGGKPMEYQDYSTRISELYTKEEDFSTTMNYATFIAFFIACLGILGMSIFIARQRVKEIGIRKVLGASVGNIFVNITSEFILLTLLSSVISFPVSLVLMNSWLNNFVYKTSIDLTIFIYSALIGSGVVFFTVSFHAVKAAIANPLHSIKCE